MINEPQRKLVAVMFADIVGYTALMQQDEQGAINYLQSFKKELHDQVADHQGKIIQYFGDGCVVIFNSSVNAIKCAKSFQDALRLKVNNPEETQIPVRIGLHSGDILHKEGNIYGDAVNISARIESMAIPGSVLFSRSVRTQIKNKIEFKCTSLGYFDFKNVEESIEVFALSNPGFPVPKREELTGKFKVEDADKSVAVLPFVNMSNDPEQEYFSDGISEEIINTLVQLPNLKVAGRTSAFSFKGKNEDLRKIGKQLGVTKILEGSVRRSGSKIRITAQLIEVTNGFHLWSQKFDREMDDIFAIQDEIAQAIVDQLQITLSGKLVEPKARKQTQNVEAYQLYFKGRALVYQRGSKLFEGIQCFKDALDLDPQYALAYAGLADANCMIGFWGLLPPEQTMHTALSAANRAITLGPELAESHNALAITSLLFLRDHEKAEKELRRALEINPAYTQARSWYAMFYLQLIHNQHDKAEKHARLGIKNDPLSYYAHTMLSGTLGMMGKHNEAIHEGEKGLKLDPEAFVAHWMLIGAYSWSNKFRQAESLCHQAMTKFGKNSWLLIRLILLYVGEKRDDDAFQLYNELVELKNEQFVQPMLLAVCAAALGKSAQAFEFAMEAFDIYDPSFMFLGGYLPESHALRSLPEFHSAMQQLGIEVNFKNIS